MGDCFTQFRIHAHVSNGTQNFFQRMGRGCSAIEDGTNLRRLPVGSKWLLISNIEVMLLGKVRVGDIMTILAF